LEIKNLVVGSGGKGAIFISLFSYFTFSFTFLWADGVERNGLHDCDSTH